MRLELKAVDPYYVSAHWRAIRMVALRRDGFRCTTPGCGRVATIVDHIVSRSQGGSDKLPNLRSLCRLCDNRVKEHYGKRKNSGELSFCDTNGMPLDKGHPWHRAG